MDRGFLHERLSYACRRPKPFTISDVRSLRAFKPEEDKVDGFTVSPEKALNFLKRYLRLTHCDLFFADAAVLVEGAVEKLLLPVMIDKSATKLHSSYLTVLEVGGAYAYRFEGLLSFLGIPYLIITDLHSVTPDAPAGACRADKQGARTSNASLKNIFGKSTVDELMALTAKEKISETNDYCVAFQCDITVTDQNNKRIMRPRTLEEALAYDNFSLLRKDIISIGKPIPDDLEEAYQTIYERIRSSTFKKTDFAMSLLAGDNTWQTPVYIAKGLVWLEAKLNPTVAPPNGSNGAEKPSPVSPSKPIAASPGEG